jgi:hypothetical protein
MRRERGSVGVVLPASSRLQPSPEGGSRHAHHRTGHPSRFRQGGGMGGRQAQAAWPRRHAARSVGGVRRKAVARRHRGDRGHGQCDVGRGGDRTARGEGDHHQPEAGARNCLRQDQDRHNRCRCIGAALCQRFPAGGLEAELALWQSVVLRAKQVSYLHQLLLPSLAD